jgi:hypothetical protein
MFVVVEARARICARTLAEDSWKKNLCDLSYKLVAVCGRDQNVQWPDLLLLALHVPLGDEPEVIPIDFPLYVSRSQTGDGPRGGVICPGLLWE